MPATRLTRIHTWMKQVAHLPFVPAVLPSHELNTVVVEVGRVWDLTRWMPGTADFRANPTPTRLANACAALAQLHRAWATPVPAFAPCPAVHRRLGAFADWRQMRPRLQTPGRRGHPEQGELIRRAAEEVARLAEPAERALLPWATRPVRVQPCLCDIWHDHVLFTGEAVTGVIDYGAMKEDNIAVDLARLLGDLSGGDGGRFAAGLHAYRDAGGPTDPHPELVRLLDHTGVLCGVIVWLTRFVVEGRTYPDPAAVAARLRQLITRLTQFSPREFGPAA
jgi:Ser/Thr protein kinase RdoA (MazF antagonist)